LRTFRTNITGVITISSTPDQTILFAQPRASWLKTFILLSVIAYDSELEYINLYTSQTSLLALASCCLSSILKPGFFSVIGKYLKQSRCAGSVPWSTTSVLCKMKKKPCQWKALLTLSTHGCGWLMNFYSHSYEALCLGQVSVRL
jgi:hypothetical protein